jgi:Skp family chaperone for outer membrane proteins
MNLRYLSVLAAVAGVCLAARGWAQEVTVKIAVVNIGKVYSDMQESKDFTNSLKVQRDEFLRKRDEYKKKIEALQAEMKNLKSDSGQFKEKNDELVRTALEADYYDKITTDNLQRVQKLQLKSQFDKIEAAVIDYATQKGIDLVLTERRMDLPEDLREFTRDQVDTVLSSRNVLYRAPKIDISSEIIAVLDSKYKAAMKK